MMAVTSTDFTTANRILRDKSADLKEYYNTYPDFSGIKAIASKLELNANTVNAWHSARRV